MRRTTEGRRTLKVMVVALAAVAGAGCSGPTLTMGYDEAFGRLVPLVKPGATIHWRGVTPPEIKWKANDSPCDPGYEEGCRIRANLKGGRFSYKCVGPNPCDPEIAVDSGVVLVGMTRKLAPGAPPFNIAIEAFCNGGLTLEAPDGEPRVGKTVSWKPMGSVPPAPWTVAFSDPGAACVNSQPTEFCELKAPGQFTYTFTSTSADCSLSKTATITVVP